MSVFPLMTVLLGWGESGHLNSKEENQGDIQSKTIQSCLLQATMTTNKKKIRKNSPFLLFLATPHLRQSKPIP